MKTETITARFASLRIFTFSDAAVYIKNLPYKRNTESAGLFCVLNDWGGTCSTKHALLKRFADEISEPDVKLMLGIFNMNAANTPKIAHVLAKNDLTEMPEAHCYLKICGQITDCTRRNSQAGNFLQDLVQELEIEPAQIPEFKSEYHKEYLRKYRNGHPNLQFSTEELWNIREECIAALQH